MSDKNKHNKKILVQLASFNCTAILVPQFQHVIDIALHKQKIKKADSHLTIKIINE
jgi:hypothetical protein